jgi:hypothetical protein
MNQIDFLILRGYLKWKDFLNYLVVFYNIVHYDDDSIDENDDNIDENDDDIGMEDNNIDVYMIDKVVIQTDMI